MYIRTQLSGPVSHAQCLESTAEVESVLGDGMVVTTKLGAQISRQLLQAFGEFPVEFHWTDRKAKT